MLAVLALGLPEAQAQVKPATTVVPVPGKTNAYLAPNGVPVVNINTANSAGVSHNQFTRYDVEAKGMVLNNGNSSQSARQSQLAGQVTANINLAAEAKVILNEVVAPNRSTLAGYTEVLGGRADVIVANPYGITCAGCGFINSDRVTLTTGTPVWGNDGSVYGFNVSRGDILVNGGGINASGQQILDLVTRAIRIDGQVNTAPGGSLGIVTGVNQWAYGSREVTGAAVAAEGASPSYAIDSSALGGMYAGRIRLIATEAGVGVRMLGDAAASVDDFQLDAAGKVLVQSRVSAARDLHLTQRTTGGDAQVEVAGTNASLTAQRDLALTANGGVTLNEGLLKAGNNLALQAASLADASAANAARSAGAHADVNLRGAASLDGSNWGAGGHLKLAADTLTVGATGTTLYSGTNAAGADRALEIAAEHDIDIERARITGPAGVRLASRAGGMRLGSGVELTAAAALALAAQTRFSNAGSALAGGDLTLHASDAGTVLQASNSGLLQATGELEAGQAGKPVALVNSAGARVLADGIAFDGSTLDNSGTIQATRALGVTATGAVTNRAGGTILNTTAGQGVTLSAASLENAGTVQSAGALDASVAGASVNSGQMLTLASTDGGNDGALNLRTGSLANSGTLAAAGAGVISAAEDIDNTRQIQAQSLALQAGGHLANRSADAVLLAQTDLDASAATVDNSGTMQAEKALLVNAANRLANSGVLYSRAADGHLALRAGDLVNSGTLQGGAAAELHSTSGAIVNSGQVLAATALDLDAATGLNNNGADAVLLAGTGLRAQAASIVNEGTVQAQDAVTLGAAGAFSNSGLVQARAADAALSLTAASVANSGKLQSAGSADLTGTGGAIVNSGEIAAAGTLGLEAAGALQNQGAASVLLAGAGLDAHAASFDNGVTVQGKTLAVTADGALGSAAVLQSTDGALDLRAGSIANTGTVQSAANAGLRAELGAIDNGGKVLAGGTLDLSAAGALVNRGTDAALLADADLNAVAASVDNRAAVQGERLSVTAAGMLDNSGTLQSGADQLALRAGAIANTGVVQAGGSADLRATAGALANSGKILADGDLALNAAATLDNLGAASQIIGQGALAIDGANGFGVNNDGRIQAAGDISLSQSGQAATLRNNAGATIFGDAVALHAADTINRGRIQAMGTGAIAGASLSNLGSNAVVLFGIEGEKGSIALSGRLRNEGAMHAGGNMDVTAAGIVNTNTAGLSSLQNLSLKAVDGGIDNAGALYAGATLSTRAPGQTITNTSSGTMDATDIDIAAATFSNYNTVIATHDTGIATTVAFNNLPTGDVPKMVAGSTSYGGVKTVFDTGDIDCNWFGDYCNHLWVRAQEYTVTQKLDGAEPVQKGQIIAGNAINLKYGQAATNTASLISAPTINIEGSGTFTNTDLHLDQITYARRWRVWKTDSTFGSLNYEYRFPTNEADFDCAGGDCYRGYAGSESGAMNSSYTLEVKRTTYKVFSAGIYADRLNFVGGKLQNLGSPYERSKTATSVAGDTAVDAGKVGGVSVSLLKGASLALQGAAKVAEAKGAAAASVPAANGVTFTGLNLNLPTNPNGYFVPAKNPTATYLVETNPLFAVGSNFVGSDYLSVRLGLNPDTVQKRLGDANYEAKLIRDQLVAQTGNNIIKGQKNEAAQMQALMDNAAKAAGTLGLNFGQPLTAEQAAGLTQDMVWMVEQEVGGQKVLVPVVYLAKDTRDSIESGGPVIAATNATIKAGSVENTGGTIAGDTLAITAEGDVRNTGGKIKGGDVSVTSTKGSIINETVADTNGGKNYARTVIGATGSIESTGKLDLDAKKDIIVTGADIKAGGDASLAAGGKVTFDTIQDKRADSSYTASQGLWGLSSSSTSTHTASSTNIGSNLETGGGLKIRSGGDTTIAGSAVKVGGDLDLDAAGGVNIVSRQDTSESNTTTTRSGLGVGGGLYGKNETTTDTFKGRNAGSTLEVGGNANIAAGETLTLQGSKLKVGGDASVSATDVQVLAGQDVDRTTTKTTTTSFLKISGSGDSSAGAGADSYADSSAGAKSKKGAASASAGAGAGASAGAAASASASASANAGLTLAETTTTNTLDYKSRAVGSELDIGGGLTVTAKKDIVLQGATVNTGGDTTLKGEKVQILASQDVDISTSKTTTTSLGLFVDSTNGAQAGASAEASAGAQASTDRGGNQASASAQAGAQAGASASSDTNIDLVRTSTTETNSLDIRNTGTTINAGGKLKIEATDKLLVQGSDIGGEQGVSLKAKDMAFTAAEDVSVTTTTTTRTSAGLYLSAGASAEAHASAGAGAMANQDSGQMNAGLNAEFSAGASAEAKAGAGIQARHSSEKTVDGSTTAKVSTIRSGSGDIERTAENSIVDVGTSIDAAGDFSQSATTIDSRAAKNTTFSSSESGSDSMRLGVYAQANAGASASASASAEAGSGMFGPGAHNGVENNSEAGANASIGIEAQYAHEQSSSSSNSSEAVVSTIRAGGKVKSTSSGKTSFEGTQIAGEGGVELGAKEIDFKAAANTESSSESGLNVNAQANVGLALGSDGVVDAGLGGGFEKSGAKSSSSTAVTGSIQSGGNLVIKTQGDARFEGTDIGAAGDASVAAGGKLSFDAAKNTSSESSNSANAEASVSISKSKSARGSESSAGLEASGGFENEKSSSSEAVTGRIASGGKLNLSSGGDMRFEGTAVQGGGDTEIDAGGKVAFDAARNTSSSESTSFSASLSLSKSSSNDTTKGESSKSHGAGIGLEGGYAKEKSSEAVAGSVESGGNLRIKSGGSASFEGTDIAAGGKAAIDAGGDVSFKAAESTSESFGVAASLGVEGSNTTKTGPKAAEAGAGKPAAAKPANAGGGLAMAATGAASPNQETTLEKERKGSVGLEVGSESSSEKKGGSIKAGGGIAINSGGNASFEGTQVQSEGDVAVAAKGDVTITTAKSSSSSVGVGIDAEGEKASNSDPAENSHAAKGGFGIEAGSETTHENASFESGGKLSISSGGRTSLVNAELKAEGGKEIAAAGGVATSTVQDSESGFRMSASARSESEPKEAPPEQAPAAGQGIASAALGLAAPATPAGAGGAKPAAAGQPQVSAKSAVEKAETAKPAEEKTQATKPAQEKKKAAKPAPAKPKTAPKKPVKKVTPPDQPPAT